MFTLHQPPCPMPITCFNPPLYYRRMVCLTNLSTTIKIIHDWSINFFYFIAYYHSSYINQGDWLLSYDLFHPVDSLGWITMKITLKRDRTEWQRCKNSIKNGTDTNSFIYRGGSLLFLMIFFCIDTFQCKFT